VIEMIVFLLIQLFVTQLFFLGGGGGGILQAEIKVELPCA